MFSEFIGELENISNWKYTGESELLILDYVDGKLDFSNVINLWLDKMIRNNIIYSFNNFLEMLIRTIKKLKGSVISIIKKYIRNLSKIYDEASYFYVRNYSK